MAATHKHENAVEDDDDDDGKFPTGQMITLGNPSLAPSLHHFSI